MAKTYHPIPGIGSGRGSLQMAIRTRLYQGPDHLLVVHSTGYTEEYKRIFYRDIRYVEVRASKRRLWNALISGSVMLFVFLLYRLILPAPEAVIFGLPFLIWFLINFFLGPACDCYAGTSVQTLKIPAPRRMNKVPRFIEFLRIQTAALPPIPAEQPVA